MIDLGKQLMMITLEIIQIDNNIKFAKEINSISVKPDLKHIEYLEGLMKAKFKEHQDILNKMGEEKNA